MVLTAIDADVSVSINIDDLLGAFSQKVLLGLKVILNFVKAKTFTGGCSYASIDRARFIHALLVSASCLRVWPKHTVVMSADLFLNLLIQLEMYEVLCKSTTKRVNDRMLAGLLLERTSAEAKDLLDEVSSSSFALRLHIKALSDYFCACSLMQIVTAYLTAMRSRQ